MTDRPNARTCIFLDEGAEEAARFYARTLPDTHVDLVQPIGDGRAMVLFRCTGTHFMLMDGNTSFAASKSHSISVATLDQAETDRLWSALAEGGREGPGGWLRDRFGVHWQVVPIALMDRLSDPDREAAGRAQAAMMGMSRIDIAGIEAAFAGRA